MFFLSQHALIFIHSQKFNKIVKPVCVVYITKKYIFGPMRISVKDICTGLGILFFSLWYPQTLYAHSAIRNATQSQEMRLLQKKNVEVLFFFHCLKTQKISESPAKRKTGTDKFVFPSKLPLVFFSVPYIHPVFYPVVDRNTLTSALFYPHHIFW